MVAYDPADEVLFIDDHLFHWYCPLCGVWYSTSMNDINIGSFAAEAIDIDVRYHWKECMQGTMWQAWA